VGTETCRFGHVSVVEASGTLEMRRCGRVSGAQGGSGDSRTPTTRPYGRVVGVRREGRMKTWKTRPNGRVLRVLPSKRQKRAFSGAFSTFRWVGNEEERGRVLRVRLRGKGMGAVH